MAPAVPRSGRAPVCLLAWRCICPCASACLSRACPPPASACCCGCPCACVASTTGFHARCLLGNSSGSSFSDPQSIRATGAPLTTVLSASCAWTHTSARGESSTCEPNREPARGDAFSEGK
eukprot:6209412-Pleurochrysis_carterae.AAC.3